MKKINGQVIIQGIVAIIMMVAAVSSYGENGIKGAMLWGIAGLGFAISAIIQSKKCSKEDKGLLNK